MPYGVDLNGAKQVFNALYPFAGTYQSYFKRSQSRAPGLADALFSASGAPGAPGGTGGTTMFSGRRRRGSRRDVRRKPYKPYPSYTSTKTKRFNVPEQFTTEYTHVAAKSGKYPRKTLKAAWRKLKVAEHKTIYRVAQVSEFGGVNGKRYLNNSNAATDVALMQVPVHLYDITACVNKNGSTVTAPNVFYRLDFSNRTETGTRQWAQSDPLVIETTDSVADEGQYPGAGDTLKWYNARMIFYCPTTRSTKISIDFVQFKDERLVPTNSVASTFADAFWQYMAKKYVTSPLEVMSTQYAKYYKVLKTMSFEMDPKDSDTAVNTRLKEVNIFMKLNKYCKYDWNMDDKVTMRPPGAVTADDNSGQINIGDNDAFVHPTKRIYMIIRGLANNNVAADQSTVHPSYDILHRVCHVR